MIPGSAGASVDVIIPTYNRAHVVTRAIDSVLSQTVPVEKIIVVDDGSKDDTEKVLSRYGNRVTFVRQANAGPSAARNTGIAHATADWVAFLDSDDYWRPDKIERQLAAIAREPGSVLSYTSSQFVSPDGKNQIVCHSVPRNRLHSLIRYVNFTPVSTVLARRDVLVSCGGFDTSFHNAEDWDLWFRISRCGAFAAVDEPVTVIVETAGSQGGNVEEMLQSVERLADKTLLSDLGGLRRLIWRRRILSAESYRGFIVKRERRAQDAMDYLRRSLLLWPSPLFIPKRYAALVLALRPGLTR